MNVGDERDLGDALADPFQRDGRIVVGDSEPHDPATGTHHLLDLCDGCADVGSVRLCHRLNRDGRTTADLNVLNLDWTRLAHYLAGAGEDAAGGRSGSLLPPNVLSKSLLITKTINNRTITNPTCCIRSR